MKNITVNFNNENSKSLDFVLINNVTGENSNNLALKDIEFHLQTGDITYQVNDHWPLLKRLFLCSVKQEIQAELFEIFLQKNGESENPKEKVGQRSQAPIMKH
ncbi:MAG: hypothetical protein ACMUEM_06060 [Flavobacteriales bacterium AspAUS03]